MIFNKIKSGIVFVREKHWPRWLATVFAFATIAGLFAIVSMASALSDYSQK